jgi:hypothetical protein
LANDARGVRQRGRVDAFGRRSNVRGGKNVFGRGECGGERGNQWMLARQRAERSVIERVGATRGLQLARVTRQIVRRQVSGRSKREARGLNRQSRARRRDKVAQRAHISIVEREKTGDRADVHSLGTEKKIEQFLLPRFRWQRGRESACFDSVWESAESGE